MLSWDDEITPAAPSPRVPQMPAQPQMLPTLRSLEPTSMHVPLQERALDPALVAKPEAASGRRVNAADKRIINGQPDVHQLVPFKNNLAWDNYLAGCANHWIPQEINMQRDIELCKNPIGLSEDERRLVK